jgi:CBS domain-containing protein
MQVRDIMTHDVICVSPETSVSEVADIIFRNRFHALPVVEKNKIVGIITENDFFLKGHNDMYLPSFIRAIAQHKAEVQDKIPEEIQENMKKLLDAKASDLMSAEVVTVAPELPVSELMELIDKTKFTTFPVADPGKKLLGIITLVDIIGTLNDGSRQIQKVVSGDKKIRDIDRLVQTVQPYWRDTFVLMSRKKVKSWKGMVFISLIAAVFAIIASFFILSSKSACEIDNEQNTSVACVKFVYSDWSPCDNLGTQTRQVIEKLPKGCQGGSFPELSQKCR